MLSQGKPENVSKESRIIKEFHSLKCLGTLHAKIERMVWSFNFFQ